MSPRATRARYAASPSVLSDCRICERMLVTAQVVCEATYPEHNRDEPVAERRRQRFPEPETRNAVDSGLSVPWCRPRRPSHTHLNMIVAIDTRKLFERIVYGASPIRPSVWKTGSRCTVRERHTSPVLVPKKLTSAIAVVASSILPYSSMYT